jgi:acetyl/propionyl-CoA carboxylase alpha subunit
MGQVAVQAAAAVGYVNAGTVEFLLAADRSFYFLEMNTRLQVEHPVTEAVTGIDIAAEQLRIAAGQALGFGQEGVQAQGWAIECRITAEDPFNDFLPSSGRIIRLSQPSGPGIRIDGGIHEGFESSMFYDPLLQKVIAWGSSRSQAIQRMRQALAELRIIGLQTSIPFHQWVMTNDCFLGGSYDTSLFHDYLVTSPGRGEQERLAAIVATLVYRKQRRRAGAGTSPCPDSGVTDASHLASGRRDSSWKLAGRWEALGR